MGWPTRLLHLVQSTIFSENKTSSRIWFDMFRTVELNSILQNPQLEVPHIIEILTTGRVCFPMIDKIDDLKW